MLRRVRWILPRHVIWLLIWVVMLVAAQIYSAIVYAAYAQQSQLQQMGLAGSIPWLVVATYGVSLILNTAIILLPIILLTIQHVFLRGVETLIDKDVEERPPRWRRALYGALVGAGAAVVTTVMYVLLTWASTQFTQLQGILIAYFGIAELLAGVAAGLITTAAISRCVARDDRDLGIVPLRSASWMMLVYTLLLVLFMFIVPFVHIWMQIQRL
jgi:hypothetical protein